MNAEEVVAHLSRVDRALNERKSVDEADLTLNITSTYRRYGWAGSGPSPLLDDAQKKLQLSDKTGDSRWSKRFRANPKYLGIYRTRVGYYWLLRYDGALGEYFLDHAGSAHEVEQRFGENATD